jgi:hypothetical protein
MRASIFFKYMLALSPLKANFNCTFFLNLRKKMFIKKTPTLFFLETQEKRRPKTTPPTQHCVGNYVFGIPMFFVFRARFKKSREYR